MQPILVWFCTIMHYPNSSAVPPPPVPAHTRCPSSHDSLPAAAGGNVAIPVQVTPNVRAEPTTVIREFEATVDNSSLLLNVARVLLVGTPLNLMVCQWTSLYHIRAMKRRDIVVFVSVLVWARWTFWISKPVSRNVMSCIRLQNIIN